jgi:ABC-2 type transport system ATP-binding protein
MIKVKNLVKRFNGTEVLKSLSFEVNKGETVGFLGPNGAGKTTTMRILTGYLPQTSGEVHISGVNCLENPMEVRRKIGYMPENAPLYLEMRVEDYLKYRAELKGVEKSLIKTRVTDVIYKCGLKEVSNKIIGILSKGYRQRVGLADALVHEPELLILDEPTAGLDPKQIRAFRHLLKKLSHEHTILLSTHILPEAEMICDRVIIINRGHIEAQDSIDQLESRVRSRSILMEIQAPFAVIKDGLEKIGENISVELKHQHEDWTTITVESKKGEDIGRCICGAHQRIRYDKSFLDLV